MNNAEGGDLSGLDHTQPVASTNHPVVHRSDADADMDDDPWCTGNPNIADTPKNLREHGILGIRRPPA